MKSKKELLIDKLIESGKISKEDGNVLSGEHELFPFKYTEPAPYLTPQERAINDELIRKTELIDRCGCNPKNGGSGVCGCTMSSMTIIS